MIKIERMNAAHVPQIAQLEKICFDDPWVEQSIAPEVENPLSLWLVAMEDTKVVAYVGSQSVLGETDMMNIAVHPDYRRRGLARLLVTKLVEELKAGGNHSLMLEVRVSNDPARKLYEKLGFVQVGLRKNYYRNPKEDACILRKEWEI